MCFWLRFDMVHSHYVHGFQIKWYFALHRSSMSKIACHTIAILIRRTLCPRLQNLACLVSCAQPRKRAKYLRKQRNGLKGVAALVTPLHHRASQASMFDQAPLCIVFVNHLNMSFRSLQSSQQKQFTGKEFPGEGRKRILSRREKRTRGSFYEKVCKFDPSSMIKSFQVLEVSIEIQWLVQKSHTYFDKTFLINIVNQHRVEEHC